MKVLGEAGVDVLIEEIRKRGNSGQISSLSDDLDAQIRRMHANYAQLGADIWKHNCLQLNYWIYQFVVAQLNYCGLFPALNSNSAFMDITAEDWQDVDNLITKVHYCLDNYVPDKTGATIGDIATVCCGTYPPHTDHKPIFVKYRDLI